MICREHCSSSKYSQLKSNAIPICSLPCNEDIICNVCDAARATSAAPTFFPVMNIENRYFSDGGLAHNNPSFAIYHHYTGYNRMESTRPTAPHFSPHGDLDCARVRITNIGTGAKENEVEPGKRDWLIPSIIRQIVFLKQTLTEIAVSSDHTTSFMTLLDEVDQNTIYKRFDADHGVSSIKLDDYKALGKIRAMTKLYLEEQEIKDLLEEVGSAIANDYIKSQSRREQNVRPTGLAIDERGQLLEASNPMPISSPLSSGASSHGDIPKS